MSLNNLGKIFWTIPLLILALHGGWVQRTYCEENPMPDKQKIMDRLHGQLTMLTRTIGERSIYTPDNLKKSADYIHAQFEDFGLSVERQTYRFNNIPVCNVLATLKPSSAPAAHYVIGAHYDTVAGTVGADDNASAVAVVLETARVMQSLAKNNDQALKITFAAFTLEEPPAYGTRHMGSRVFAKKAKEQDMAIDGMICLEMVGYTCSEPGCQHYPFPLRFLGYPKTGTFIGIVGNLKSLSLTRKLRKSFKQNPELPVVSLTVPFNGWIMPAVRLSDHASFWSKGYRAVMLTDSAYFRNPHYHLLSDSMQTLDFSYMAELVRSLVLFLRSPHP